MTLDQAGPATIARENIKKGRMLAIKRLKTNKDLTTAKVPIIRTDYIIKIENVFVEYEAEVVVVYKQMDVNLRHIRSVVSGPLHAFEIAAICKDV